MIATLARTTFETSRELEFFTEKELTMQIGHAKPLWPIALVKELIDNALDAAETAGTAPEIAVALEEGAVTVADNGPGLPTATLKRSLDYLIRVSDKAHYISPSRGQLGNALKCVWAAPFVAHGGYGCVEVASAGQRHTEDRAADAPIPGDLAAQVAARIEGTADAWDTAIWDLVNSAESDDATR